MEDLENHVNQGAARALHAWNHLGGPELQSLPVYCQMFDVDDPVELLEHLRHIKAWQESDGRIADGDEN